ncbi:hypothetical protein Pan44_27030 [Caulifigura coniformis]|uniref:Uncharacterized protein n=1 Tax=Caulifigura coniformis TaxID=2527983 RepID=A0A517SEZ0_9PLAN|nr:hypothetical protein [Caulifigura coniformis]QDT54668.1 hypothetical protein Pan44_27030 [Caulifigura coniformis]
MKTARKAPAFASTTRMRSQVPQTVSDPLDAELWVPTRFDATIPLRDAHWLRTHFPDAKDAEAFISMAVVSAVAEAKGGRR